jgi:hypothetical protein
MENVQDIDCLFCYLIDDFITPYHFIAIVTGLIIQIMFLLKFFRKVV